MGESDDLLFGFDHETEFLEDVAAEFVDADVVLVVVVVAGAAGYALLAGT